MPEVSHLVVIVPGLMESISDPVEERHFGVGVMPPDAKDDHVDGDEKVGEARQAEAVIGGDEDGQPDHRREGLQEPSEEVVGMEDGPAKNGQYEKEEAQVEPVGGHGRIIAND